MLALAGGLPYASNHTIHNNHQVHVGDTTLTQWAGRSCQLSRTLKSIGAQGKTFTFKTRIQNPNLRRRIQGKLISSSHRSSTLIFHIHLKQAHCVFHILSDASARALLVDMYILDLINGSCRLPCAAAEFSARRIMAPHPFGVRVMSLSTYLYTYTIEKFFSVGGWRRITSRARRVCSSSASCSGVPSQLAALNPACPP